MLKFDRFGIRNQDDNPVVETSTYVAAEEDHPLAVQLEGHDGWWVRIAVGNSLSQIGARQVTKAQFDAAKDEIEARVEANRAEAEERRNRAQAELDAKKAEVRAELAKLGLSPSTIKAILDQVRTG